MATCQKNTESLCLCSNFNTLNSLLTYVIVTFHLVAFKMPAIIHFLIIVSFAVFLVHTIISNSVVVNQCKYAVYHKYLGLNFIFFYSN